MTFISRSRALAAGVRAPASVLALTALVFMVFASCDNKHVGRYCELGVTDPGTPSGGGSTATINSQALECPSRICILPGQENGGTDTQALCTAECGSDDDCSDGEGGPKGNGDDHHCESGFACVVPTTVGDFCCRRMCVCRDFLNINPQTGYQIPAICRNGGAQSCRQ